MKRLKYQPSNNQKSSPLTTKTLTVIRIFVIIAEVLALSLADTANETDILLGNRYRSFSFLIFAAVPIGGFILLHFISKPYSKGTASKIISIIIALIMIFSYFLYDSLSPDDLADDFMEEIDNSMSDDSEYLDKIGKEIDFNFPESLSVISIEVGSRPYKYENVVSPFETHITHYSKTNISLDCYSEDDYSGRSFSQKMHNELKKSISEDSRWKKVDSLPSRIKPLLTENFEYMLIYNKELKTFNIEPDDKKSYSYIMLAYTPEKDLCIIEYTK